MIEHRLLDVREHIDRPHTGVVATARHCEQKLASVRLASTNRAIGTASDHAAAAGMPTH